MIYDPRWANAISGIESSGRYGLLGPVTKSGDRAFGKYQVMGNNVGPWTREALGREMTPQDFLNDPAAQDAVFKQQFSKNVEKYGSPQDAASVWFSGRPVAKAGNAQDILGTTVPAYVAKFNRFMGEDQGVNAINEAAHTSSGGAPMPFEPTSPPDNGFLGQLGLRSDFMTGANGGYGLSRRLGRAGAALMAIDNPRGAAVINEGIAEDDMLPIRQLMMAQKMQTQQPVGSDWKLDDKTGTFYRTTPTGDLESKKNPNAVTAAEIPMSRIQGIIDGREPYPSPNSRAPDAAAIREKVHELDPSFDAVNYNSRLKTRQNFTSGKGSENLSSFNTSINHLGEMEKAIDGLNNGGWSPINAVSNAVASRTDPNFDAALKEFEAAKTAVSSELTRAFRGTGGNVHDLIEWEKSLSPNSSPQALHAAVRKAATLLKGRIDAVGETYNRGMGTTKDPMELLSPDAAEAFKGILSGGGGKPTHGASDVEAEMRRRGLLK